MLENGLRQAIETDCPPRGVWEPQPALLTCSYQATGETDTGEPCLKVLEMINLLFFKLRDESRKNDWYVWYPR